MTDGPTSWHWPGCRWRARPRGRSYARSAPCWAPRPSIILPVKLSSGPRAATRSRGCWPRDSKRTKTNGSQRPLVQECSSCAQSRILAWPDGARVHPPCSWRRLAGSPYRPHTNPSSDLMGRYVLNILELESPAREGPADRSRWPRDNAPSRGFFFGIPVPDRAGAEKRRP
jgi:hypothetical protein